MARKLKGSVIQQPPSWNIKRMAGSSFGGGPVALGEIWAVGLLNNATQGEWLVVWDVQVLSIPGGATTNIYIVDFALMHGRTGSFFADQPNHPLASGVASLPGLVWADKPSQEQGAIFNSISMPQAGFQWPHDWPFCAIQPGDSCVGYSNANADTFFGIRYIYEVVPGGL